MFENLNDFFTATYTHNKIFYGIQLVAVMSLMGIGLGLLSRISCKGWKGILSRLQVKKS